MDGGLNKIITALIAVFAITFLLLLAQILFFLTRRRCNHTAAGQLKEKYVCPLFWRNNSRIEPREIVSKAHDDSEVVMVEVETVEGSDELDKWRQLIGPSRDLFTINEEEEEDREGIESCEYDSKPDCDTTPFHTPCGSPPFFTPSPPSSPTRYAGGIPDEKDSSSDGGDRTAPFFAIEITDY